MELVARAAPNGYTIGYAGEGPLAINRSAYPIDPDFDIAEHTGLNAMTDMRFSKVPNMAHSINLAAAIRSARVRFDYQSANGCCTGRRLAAVAGSIRQH